MRLGQAGSDARYGFGAAPLGDLRRVPSDADAGRLVDAAWDAGLRHFDTAPFYGSGLSERRLGDALRGRPRDGFTLSTKVGRLLVPDADHGPARWGSPRAMPFRPVYDYSYDGVMRSFDQSLQRLGLVGVDMVLLHDIGAQTHGTDHPEVFRTAMSGGMRALLKLRDEGVVRAVGIGVNEWQVCVETLEQADIDCLLLAGRYTLLDQSALRHLLPMCLARGVGVLAGSVFHRGILATGAVEGALEYGRPAEEPVLRSVAAIEAVCRSHGVSLPAAALAFPLSHPAVRAVLPGFSNMQELQQNLAHMATPVPAALWADLADRGLIDPAGTIRG